MKENGTMNWLAQIRQMKNRDIRTIEQHELQELPQDADVFGAVVGTKDAHLAADQLEQFCKARAIPCLIVPDAGHRLQFEDADKTQAVNRSITAMLR